MPKSKIQFRAVKKVCKHCKKELILNNARDIQRKTLCSRTCGGMYRVECNKKILGFYDKVVKAMNTPEANCKKNFPGEKSNRWIKDRSKLKNKRFFFEEKEFIKEVLKERNYTCEITGEIGGRLSVHHKNGVKNFPHLRYDKKNVIVIKRSIHRKFHKLYGTSDVIEYKWNLYISNKEYAITQ